jgi:hypothetical protein
MPFLTYSIVDPPEPGFPHYWWVCPTCRTPYLCLPAGDHKCSLHPDHPALLLPVQLHDDPPRLPKHSTYCLSCHALLTTDALRAKHYLSCSGQTINTQTLEALQWLTMDR